MSPNVFRGVRLAQINLKGMVKLLLEDVCADVQRTAKQMGVQTSGVKRMPTRTSKIALLRSPFVNKGAQEQVSFAACNPTARNIPVHRPHG